MKSFLYDQSGGKKSEIELPSLFGSTIREDISAKLFEAEKFILRQPYSTYKEAGKRHSASGTISHLRHTWKGHYGKGISRAPRKTMYRRGTQFFWIGAEVSQARGGRVAHPPHGVFADRKINQKEKRIALYSALASTFDSYLIKNRYSTLKDSRESFSSAVIEFLPAKTKDILTAIKKIFGNLQDKIIKSKEIRAGKGKRRGRKYKSNAGLLIIKGKDEKVRFNAADIKSVAELTMHDLYPLGRLTLYTKKAIDELNDIEKKEFKK